MHRTDFRLRTSSFFVGSLIGIILEIVGLALFNYICREQGCVVKYTWCNLVPIPLFVGLAMTQIIRNYPFRD